MLSKYKRLIVAAVIAASAAVVIPAATPASAMAPCQGRSIMTVDWTQSVAVVGAYTAAGATDVWLTCGIVRNGQTVARISENTPGPVAGIAATATVPAGSFSVCYELSVSYVDRPSTHSDTCP